MEQDPMIRDALHPDLESYLGKGLEPKIGGTKKTDTFYGPDVAVSRHLTPQYHIARYHELDPRLSHAHDDAHDVTPFHYHEHAILKASPSTEKPVKGLSLTQLTNDKQHIFDVESGHAHIISDTAV